MLINFTVLKQRMPDGSNGTVRHFYFGWACSFVFLFISFLGLNGQKITVDFPEKKKDDLQKIRATDIDLTGTWEITVTQIPFAGMPIFENRNNGIAHAEIKQNGNRITGRVVCNARFEDNMGRLYYEKDFKGSFDGKTMDYEDFRVTDYLNTHRVIRNLETCLKESQLDFYIVDGDYYLEGRWEGVGHLSGGRCSPGQIKFRKLNPKEEESFSFDVNFPSAKAKTELVLRKDKTIKKLKDRKVRDGKTVKVKSKIFNIEIYDHKKNDGDIVSINYNGKWILEEFSLEKEKHIIDVMLDEDSDKNFIILYAHNLGDVPPNTAAVIVDDGHRKQRFVLNSDLKQSDVLYFEYSE